MGSGGSQGPGALVPETEEKSTSGVDSNFEIQLGGQGTKTRCPDLVRCFPSRNWLPGLSVQTISRLGARVPATEIKVGRPGERKHYQPPSSIGHPCHHDFRSIHHDRYRLEPSVQKTSLLGARVPAAEKCLGRPVNNK